MGQNGDNGGTQTELILVVYGESPRSMRARENLRKALDARRIDPRSIKTFDMMTEPQLVLELRTIAVPQLLVGALQSERCLCGDLSDSERLDCWLDEMLAPVNTEPAKANAPRSPGPAHCVHQSQSHPGED